MATPAKPSPAITIAAIDLGSNAVRLEIGRLQPGRVIEILCDEREPARLGRDVFRTGELSPEARKAVIDVGYEPLFGTGDVQLRHKEAVR